MCIIYTRTHAYIYYFVLKKYFKGDYNYAASELFAILAFFYLSFSLFVDKVSRLSIVVEYASVHGRFV